MHMTTNGDDPAKRIRIGKDKQDYSVEEVAAMLSVDPETVRIWLEQGTIEGFKKDGQWRIPSGVLIKLLIP